MIFLNKEHRLFGPLLKSPQLEEDPQWAFFIDLRERAV
jgi:hypothetical protein